MAADQMPGGRPDPPGGRPLPRPLLGPHVVGRRVVVRRLLRGRTGPTGGPAMTDVLGVCEGWAEGQVSVRTDEGEVVTFPTADVVAGKPVPPPPPPRRHTPRSQ